jgi:hypothetical protein
MLALVLQLPPGDVLIALALATILLALGAGVDLPADDSDA